MKPKDSPKKQAPEKTRDWRAIWLSAFLVFAVLAVFGQTVRFDFVDYDDPQNVYENPVVEKGLSVEAVGWAFTHPQISSWIPLTTLSHMLDCQFFGLHAGGHHLVNVLLHAANAVLLFLVLREMTGSLWRSAFVAAVFAVHPLRVESVAWISERKDVLSAFFFLLALWAYVRNVRKPFYAGQSVVAVLFTLGLLAKSMVATLPFALLLLDYWPLRRFQNTRQFLRLVQEKIPLLALSVASCVSAVLVHGLIVTGARRIPLLERIPNAVVSCAIYLRQMVFPANLATPYPMPPTGQPMWEVCLALFLVAAISAVAIARRKDRPYLLTGWLWFLGILVPVIGIVQISPDAAHADRYTYLSEIGLAIAGTWAVADWSVGWKHRPAILGGLIIVAMSALTVLGYVQTSYWQDNESLWSHTLACTGDNFTARLNRGQSFAERGNLDEANVEYQEAVRIRPDYSEGHYDLANILCRRGKLDEGIDQYRKALEIEPGKFDALNNLGNALVVKGAYRDAVAQFRKAIDMQPGFAVAHYNLANVLSKRGRPDEAISQYRKALEIEPDKIDALYNLARVLTAKGKDVEAAAQYQKILEINPSQFSVQNDLAWLLATTSDKSLRNATRAIALASQAGQASGGANPLILHTLAVAYAADGNYGQATEAARHALALAVDQKQDALAATLKEEIGLFEANSPLPNTSR